MSYAPGFTSHMFESSDINLFAVWLSYRGRLSQDDSHYPLDKNITHPRLFPQIPACPFFSSGTLPAHKDPLLHQNTALDGGDSAWRAPPAAVLGHQRRSPPPKKKVTLLSQGVIRDYRRNLQSGFTKKTGKECAPRQARPDRWHHSGAGAGGRAEELRLCDGCPQVAELHRGTAMHGK